MGQKRKKQFRSFSNFLWLIKKNSVHQALPTLSSYQKPAYLQIQRFSALLELIYDNADLLLFPSFFTKNK